MPNALAAIFPDRRALLVVVHATSPRQALDQSALALDAGADGGRRGDALDRGAVEELAAAIHEYRVA